MARLDRNVTGNEEHQSHWALGLRQGQHFFDLRQRVLRAKAPHPLALEGPQPTLKAGDNVATLLAARCAQVLGAFVAFALDQPQAQPLKVARREVVEGQGVGCTDEGRLWDGVGPGSGAPFCV